MNDRLIQAGMIVLALGIGASAGAVTRYERTAAAPQESSMSFKTVGLKTLDEEQLKTVQLKLKDLGLYKVEIDGMPSTQTRTALASYFEHQRMFAKDGRISDDALRGLGFDDGAIARLHEVEQGKRGQ